MGVYLWVGRERKRRSQVKLKLYYSSKHELSKIDENAGFDFDEILGELRSLEAQGQASFSIVDTSELSGADLFDAYIAASVPAVLKGHTMYNISRVFGTKRSKGIFFGREVPAMLVYGEMDQHPTDVYPHRIGQAIITIKEFLEKILSGKR
jgi:hypothetical protein